MNNKSKIKVLVIIVLFAIVATSITGCAWSGGPGSFDDGPKPKSSLLYDPPGDEGKETAQKIDVFALYTFDVTALCGDDGPIKGQSFGSPLRDFTILMYNTVFNTGTKLEASQWGSHETGSLPIEPVAATKALLEATEAVLTIDYTTGELALEGALDFESVLSVIKSAANAILIAVWSMGFISQIVNEKFTMDTLLKTLMQLLIGIVLVNNGDKLVAAFANIGSGLADALDPKLDLAATFSTFTTQIQEKLKPVRGVCLAFDLVGIDVKIGTLFVDIGGDQIGAILLMLLPFLGQLLCTYKILSMMIMRMLELVVRIIFAPIPIAFSAQSGFSQEAIRYFRGILACAAQPALIIVAASCVGPIISLVCQVLDNNPDSTAASLGGWTASIAIFIAYMCLSAFIGETKRLAQEIIGR